MLQTVIDYSIFDDFTKNQPAQFPLGSIDENEIWISFMKYLKEGSDVVLTNYKSQDNIFLNCLTTGRKNTKFLPEEKFNKPHNFKFPKNQNIQTVFFIDEKSEDNKKKYKNKNGFLFGFMNDYNQVWKNLSLIKKYRVLTVGKKANIKFESWDQLSDYILPFTDLIITDRYIFDETSWDYNLFEIINKFSQKTNLKFNLMLVSFVDNLKLYLYKDIEQKIKEKLSNLNISCNLSIVLAPQQIAIHDRGILSNYIYIKSGDSFNYFDRNNEIITHGTDISFNSLSNPENFNSANALLKNIKRIIEEIKNRPDSGKRIFGELEKNRLIY